MHIAGSSRSDLGAFLGMLLFVAPVVWIFLRYWGNRLGSELSQRARTPSWIRFWRDSFGAAAATVGTLVVLAALSIFLFS